MGIPSIVVGVFVFAALVKPLQHYSGFAGSVALAFIMLPVMARTTEDILNLVPNELRESASCHGRPALARDPAASSSAPRAAVSSPAPCSPSCASPVRRRRCFSRP